MEHLESIVNRKSKGGAMQPDRLKVFRLHARSNQFQKRVESAKTRITEFGQKSVNPYIAFSGGKDSLCCLFLMREQFPATPAVYFDADCAYPGVEMILNDTENCIRHEATEPFLDTLARLGIHHPDIEQTTMETTVYGPIKSLLNRYGFDGVIYGLRAEESRGRYIHAARRGAVFQYSETSLHGGSFACQPIFDWSYNDVWSYIVENNLKYCNEYDLLWQLPPNEQRISYWAGESNRHWGRYARLKMLHPDLFNRLAKRCPEVRNFT